MLAVKYHIGKEIGFFMKKDSTLRVDLNARYNKNIMNTKCFVVFEFGIRIASSTIK